MRARYGLALVKMLAVLAAAHIGGCGGGDGQGAGPGGATADTTIASIVITDGNGQTGTVGAELSRPLVVRVLNAGGATIAGAAVSFRVTAGGGSVFAGSATSDASGIARERWTLGVTAAQAQQLEARAVGAAGAALTATFSAAAVPGPAARLVATSGANQSALQAQPLASTVVLAVQDALGNGVAGTPVSLAASNGGHVTPASAQSDAAGEVRANWTLGIPVGTQRLTATAPNLPALEVQANAMQAPPGAPARIAVSLGDGQTVVQHALLEQPLEAWVTDALGNAVPNTTVTFGPVAGGPYFRASTGVQAGNGYVRWQGYFHTPGTQLVEARVSPDIKVTFTVNVTPSTHRLDGSYGCHYFRGTSASGFALTFTNGTYAGSPYGSSFDPTTISLDEGTGIFSGVLREGHEAYVAMSGTFTVDQDGRASASGSYIWTDWRGQPLPLPPDTWTCSRE